MSKLSARSLIIVLALVALVHCRMQSAAEPAVEPHPRAHPADVLRAARWLPAHTLALAATDDLEGLAEVLGRRQIMSRFREQYERAVFEIVAETGWDLLSPAGLADLGVDVNGQAAVALVLLDDALDPWSEAVVVVAFELLQPERFKAELYRAAGRLGGGPPLVVNDAVILGDGDGAVMIVDEQGFIVSARGDARAACAELARLGPADALVHHRPYRTAMASLGGGGRVRGYVDFRGLAYMQKGLDPRWAGSSLAEAASHLEQVQRDALVRARERQLPVADIVALDDRFTRRRKALFERGEEPTIRELLGLIGGGAFALAPRADGLDLRLVVDMPEQALLARLLLNQPQPLPLVSGGAGTPAALVQLRLDPELVVDLLRLALPDMDELTTMLGFDLAVELPKHLNGELGLALSLPPGGFAAVEGFEQLRLLVLVGLAGGAQIEELLAGLSADYPDALEREGDGFVLKVAEQRLRVTVQGDRLTIGSTPTASSNTTDAAVATSWRSSRPLRLALRGNNALAIFAQLALTQLGEGPGGVVSQPVGAVPWHDPALPKSEAYVAKIAELESLGARIAVVEDRRRTAERERFSAQMAAFGEVALTVRRAPAGLALEASYRTQGESVVEVVGGLVDRRQQHAASRLDFSLDEAELAELLEERRRIDDELEVIYGDDLARQQNGEGDEDGGDDEGAKDGG